MQEEDLFSGLSKFGLSPYEIKVYTSLLTHGPQTSTAVVKNAGVPQPRIYDLFDSLIRKGLIEVSPGKRRIYHAVPISISLRQEVSRMGNYVDELEKYVEASKVHVNSKIPYLWMVEGEKKISEKINSMIAESRNEIIMSLSIGRLRSSMNLIKAAIARGVTVALVLFSDASEEDIRALSKDIVLKKRDAGAAEVIMVDRKEGMINVASMRKDTGYALYYEEDELVHVLNYYFYHILWVPSVYLNDFVRMGHRRICTAWLACEAIESYQKDGGEITGEVEGMMNDQKIRIKGVIIGTKRVPGISHTFFIKSEERTYSVGGKTAYLEDIKLHQVNLSKKLF